MELYTSLVRLKAEMNGGTVPPMTPLSEKARRVIDPSFTIGMGALCEDAQLGLRCPVRGCGKWFHQLSQHLSHSHKAIGGAGAVREALDIPRTVPLMTKAARESIASHRRGKPEWKARMAQVRGGVPVSSRAKRADSDYAVTERSARIKSKLSINERNFRDRCEAQLAHKLIALQTELGRSPSKEEAIAKHGEAFVQYLRAVYGSWNNAKAQFGLERYTQGQNVNRRRLSKESVLEGLRAWVDAHGDLPRITDAMNRDAAPLLPAYQSIQRAFDAASWPEAMRRAAAILDIRGGRYGLPDSSKVA